MLRFVPLILLIFFLPLVLRAGVFPDLKFEGESAQLFQLLQEEYDSNPAKALVLANQLQSISSERGLEAYASARLIYAFLLLENDSIVKSWEIVSDTSLVNYQNLEGDVSSLYLLVSGAALNYKAEYRKAEQFLRSGSASEPKEELQILFAQELADNLRFQGRLEEAYVNALKALDISESASDSARIVDSSYTLGLIEFVQDELDNAERSMQLVLSFYRTSGNRKKVAEALSILGLIDYQRREYTSSIDKGLRAYEIRKDIGDRKGQGESLNNLALAHMGQRNWTQALRYLEDALLLKTSSNDLSQITVILNNIGQCHRYSDDTAKAIISFQRALQKGLDNGQLRDAIRSQRNLVKVYAAQNDYRNAFLVQQQMMALNDSLMLIENKQAIKDLKVKYDTQRKEAELDLLQKENAIVTNRWLTLALGLFFLLILGILVYDNQKRKHKQETDLMVAEDELQKAELKIMAEVLEHNQQKLRLYTENLLRKNELVEELESQLKTDGIRTGEEQQHEIPQISKPNIKSVRILTDDDWEEFKELFDGVHSGLLDRLLQKYQDMTLAEQRLFLLMKLSMSTKQIANILGVSPDSVKKGRYRLKKKLNVENETSLQSFVDHFN